MPSDTDVVISVIFYGLAFIYLKRGQLTHVADDDIGDYPAYEKREQPGLPPATQLPTLLDNFPSGLVTYAT